MDLGPADAGEVLTLQRAAYVTEAQAHDDLALPALRQSLEDLSAELTAGDVLAHGFRSDPGGRLLAAVRVRLSGDGWTVAHVGRLAVVPDHQGRGLGTGLLAAVEERLPDTVRELRLFTGERSHGNLRLYRRLGFSETHREPLPAGYDLVHLSRPRTLSGPV